MDVVPLPTMIKLIELFGPIGLIALIWYVDTRNFQKLMETWRTDTGKLMEERRQETEKILKAYREDVNAVREMYRNNVKLVEAYEVICRDLHDLVVLNVEKLQGMTDKIDQNEFCPLQRLRKTKIEVGG